MIKVLKNGGVSLHTNLSNLQGGDIKHNIRHPVEILDIKMKKIATALKALDKELESNESDTTFDYDASVEKRIFDYVQAIDELYDTSFLIMKAVNETISKDNSNAILWCKENCKDNYSDFKGSVDRYHDIIRVISNKIKHDSLRNDFVTLVDNKDNPILGFYFSNIIGENNLNGADLDIHAEYEGSSTAFSYNHFIKSTVGLVFYMLEKLNATLFKEKKLKNNEFLAFSESLSLISVSEKYKPLFFPDEFNKYVLSVVENKDSFSITFPYKQNKRIGFFITGVKPSFRFTNVGGVNTSINKLPYHKLIWS
ncbi:hypothetical protein KUL42_43660 [Alteromonas sp. KUL42]|uniref:hypothetical protein n=1 Tax=Alteromonas sp. KUL42 TaxID=2480797 RepID=UPI001035EB3B|nr:hypothetical protein [Alteromonas sp. KUL42]TAP30042.1 hypothetical protein EYR97_21665 [Alteromonas sp. KUL42]GEA09605.1 hypothetical protein KUL42_43660 [Alteromonas sp. KUL42]